MIYVQLESFIDPDEIRGLELSGEAAPTWNALTGEYSSGYLTVPVVGAGTANTECEVLTGMSTRFFGPGEYPYQTQLDEKTVESVAYDLRKTATGPMPSTTTGPHFTVGTLSTPIWGLTILHLWNICRKPMLRRKTGQKTAS